MRRQLFAHLDKVEDILGKQRYLAGDRMTEADVRLFMTLIRFDEARPPPSPTEGTRLNSNQSFGTRYFFMWLRASGAFDEVYAVHGGHSY